MRSGSGSLAGNIVRKAAVRLPVRRLAALAGLRVLTPYYHMVSDDPPPYLVPATYRFPGVAEFERGLDDLLADFRPLALGEFIAVLKNGGPWPERAFLLSFDDGYREAAEVVAPILLRKGVPATFFVCSGMLDNARLCVDLKAGLIQNVLTMSRAPERAGYREILEAHGLFPFVVRAGMQDVEPALDAVAGRMGIDWASALTRYRPYLTTEQVRKLLADGFTIGAHSIDHPLYHRIPLDEQLRQTRESMDAIQRRFGLDYRAFAFPYGEHGMGRAFFETIAGERSVDVLFGARGLIEDEFASFCVQRLWFEDFEASAGTYLRSHLAEKLVRRLIGRDSVRRGRKDN